MKTILSALALATIATFAAAPATATSAEAGFHGRKSVIFFKPFVYRQAHVRVIRYVAPVAVASYAYVHSNSCDHSYRMWQHTHSHYWKSRYYGCKGWW